MPNLIDLIRLGEYAKKEAISIMMENGNSDDELLSVYCDFLYGLGNILENTILKIAAICGEAIAKETVWKPEIND